MSPKAKEATAGAACILILILILGAIFLSASGIRAKIDECENVGGVWHQSNCMKAEYFHDLEKK